MRRAVLIFAAYIIAATFPVLPYSILSHDTALEVSIAGTMLTLFAVGAAKTFFTGLGAIRSGIEMLGIGVLAGIVGYLAGHFVAI